MEPSDFCEFIEASAFPLKQEDKVDRVVAFVKRGAMAARAVRNEVDAISALGDDWSAYKFSFKNLFYSCCEPTKMVDRIWETGVMLLDQEVIRPMGVSVDCDAIVRRAVGVSDSKSSYTETDLELWDASRIRAEIFKEIGDPRELAIRQLKKRVFSVLRREPENPLVYYSYLHSYSRFGVEINNVEEKKRLEDLIKLLLHLQTGAAPTDIEIPSIYGLSDGQKVWDRAQLFLKQKSPFEGVHSLRFTATKHVMFWMTDELFAKLHAAWKEAMGDSAC